MPMLSAQISIALAEICPGLIINYDLSKAAKLT
jgi:hypothetical protein